MQGREPVVARADRHMPVLLQVVEEPLHQRDVDLLEGQPFEGHPPLVAAVPEQQRERVAVGSDRVRAQVALCGEVVAQEAGQVHGEIGRLHHGALHAGMMSPNAALTRTATSGNNSAVKCR